MISILIPTYNAVCLSLIEKMYKQAIALRIPFEILLADDASCENIRQQNRKIAEWQGCRYLQKEENQGPARIRNYLASEAQYPYLLFLDSDVMPVSDFFIAEYLKVARPGLVVCGGFVYPRKNIPANAILRYKYGMAVEEQSAEQRNREPYNRFISMNFMICRDAFLKVCFDESFHLGYEDTLFGMQLEQAGVEILHIDNAVYHLVEENSEQFLMKIRRAVRNLDGHIDQMHSHVKLLRWYTIVKRLQMVPVVVFLFKHNEKRLVSNLTSQHPSLNLFAFYKLGYLCTFLSEKKSRQ